MNESTGPRAEWIKPEVYDLPRLTELTLATGGPGIPGGDTTPVSPGGGVIP